MKKIAIATATRAEYGILHPLLVRLMEEKEFDVQLLVTGTHLEEQFGYTVKEIEKDGIPIARKIPILTEDNSPYGISVTCLLYTSPSPRDVEESRMPSSA